MATRIRDRQIRNGRVLLEMVSASSQATVDFLNLGTYRRYEIEIDNLVVATNATSLRCRVSTDNGATWKAGGSDYCYIVPHASAGVMSMAFAGSSANAFIQLTPALLVTTANCVMDGRFWVLSPSATTRLPVVSGEFTINGTAIDRGFCGGQYQTAGAINGIRFFISSGNIASGEFRLFGHP